MLGSHPYWLGHDRVMADEFFRPYFGAGHLRPSAKRCPGSGTTPWSANNNSILGVKASQLDRKWTERRLGLVDADDARVRPARRLRRLGVCTTSWRRGSASRTRNSPEQSFRSSEGGQPREHDPEAGRRRQPVRDRRAGAGRHGAERRLPRARGRRRHQVQGDLPPGGVLPALARRLRGRRPAAGERDRRHGLLRAGGLLPDPARSSSSTPSPRRSSATRTPASTTAPSTASA